MLSLETQTRIRDFEISGRVDHLLNDTDNINTVIVDNPDFEERDRSTHFTVSISRELK